MDQLDLLKKDWKKQEDSFQKVSYDELSKLIHKKSSSIVKWIFYISILELVVPIIVLLFTGNDTTNKEIQRLGLSNFINIFYIITYVILGYFIYLFYKNYKSISANSNSRILIQNIIKTRKIVKYYIWFNIAIIPILSSVVFYKAYNSTDFLEKIPDGTNMIIVWLLSLILIVIVMAALWLFYQLLYGILLKRLNKNYRELVTGECVDEL